MKRQARTSIPERLGRWTGRVWRGYKRRETRVLQWMQAKGVPVTLAKVLLWTVKLLLIGCLLYVLFWGTLILIFGLLAARIALNTTWEEEEEWAIGEQRDHKDSMFYDPVAYNDTTDPRFEDD